ncbi:TPA: carbohydrate ABC transporter permease [Streptococcus suis]|uniref:ABC transporter permease n=1 Tax=Streptococcus suis TaxID=1307 RepID=A0AAD0KU76_STRSU|nr:sugar ABC transporter permease [Streptococcus suis]AWX95164.1 ABC transporter permease [Streptococcus suis]AWX97112.1 ABC transporter permease [Streptococcus suis]MBL6502908.1 sugar ABC transporter permease [Streptococcus suis]MBM0240801.1 sugar ABC transporter permease [Streptococcus suis]MBM7203635.1 sugar ABC transporter permease [Streptococcus suis]
MIAKNRESVMGYLFLSPAMLILGLFLFLPTLLSIYYAFTDYYLLTPDATSFVGLDNFIKLFQDPLFMQSLKNIGQFVIFIIPIQLGLALGLALLVNNKRKSTIFFKVAFFAPVVMSLVVVSVLWLVLLNPSSGLINSILQGIGIDPQPFLTSPEQAMFVIIAVSAWQGAGYQMLIFLAGLQNIPSSLYEAASIDGASKLKQFFHITLPMLKPTSILILTTTLIDAFKLVIQPMVMTQGGPLNSTLTPVYYIYRTGFTDRMVGYASSITVIFGLIIILFTVLQRKLTGDEGYHE